MIGERFAIVDLATKPVLSTCLASSPRPRPVRPAHQTARWPHRYWSAVHVASTRNTHAKACCSCDDASSTRAAPAEASSSSHRIRLCCALHCRLQPAHTLHPSLHITTPDAVVEGRIAHHSTQHALGHGYRQSCNCASHRWRAQTCDACPERGGPVEERFGQLVEAVQEE